MVVARVVVAHVDVDEAVGCVDVAVAREVVDVAEEVREDVEDVVVVVDDKQVGARTTDLDFENDQGLGSSVLFL